MTRLVSELAGAELALWVARAQVWINPDVCQPDEAVFVGEDVVIWSFSLRIRIGRRAAADRDVQHHYHPGKRPRLGC
jgi:hypothetical protein